MALRIGGAKPPMPEEQAMPDMQGGPEEMPDMMMGQDQAMGDPAMMDQPQGGGMPQSIAVYRDPAMGPFKCSNCQYFIPDSACEFVEGPIHAEGFCNIFNSKTAAGGTGDQPDEAESPDEAAASEDQTEDQAY